MSSSLAPFALAPPLAPTLPGPETLALFVEYNHPFPGIQRAPPPLSLTTLTTDATFTVVTKIEIFLSEVAAKLRPNAFASAAISQATITSGSAVQSAVRNFYTVSDSDTSDVIPPESAKPLNAVLTTLELAYNTAALRYLISVLDAHVADTVDNPHHDTVLADVWVDFFQALYTAYLVLYPSSTVTLAEFIASKTTALTLANIGDFIGTPPTDADAIPVPANVFDSVFSWHEDGTTSLIHANTIQTVLFAEIDLPAPSLSLAPELYFDTYTIATGSSPPFYYAPISIYDEFPRNKGTIFVRGTLNQTTTPGVNIVKFTSTTSSDSLLIAQSATTIANCYATLVFRGTTYTTNLLNIASDLLVVITYTAAGLNFFFLDQTGTQQTATLAVSNLYLNFNQMQVGLPIARSQIP